GRGRGRGRGRRRDRGRGRGRNAWWSSDASGRAGAEPGECGGGGVRPGQGGAGTVGAVRGQLVVPAAGAAPPAGGRVPPGGLPPSQADSSQPIRSSRARIGWIVPDGSPAAWPSSNPYRSQVGYSNSARNTNCVGNVIRGPAACRLPMSQHYLVSR